jgi:hypothetical protein
MTEFARRLYELLRVKVDENPRNATNKLYNMISRREVALHPRP